MANDLPAAPEWLTKRDGGLRAGLNDSTLLVVLDGHPLYRLVARPSEGKVMCEVTQTNNGKRLDEPLTYADRLGAFAGGLEQLRAALGWR